jgi:hypothetical protein
MQDSWLEDELTGGKKEDFMTSSNINQSGVPEPNTASRPPPPAPVIMKSTIATPGGFPAVKEVDSDEGEDDLQIDRKPTKTPVIVDEAGKSSAKVTPAPQSEPQHGRESEPARAPPKPNDPNLEMRKKIFKYNLAAIILAVISSSVIVFCFVKAFKGFDQSYFPFDSIKASWGKEFIIDIKQKAAATKECPTNYVPAFNYAWPGSVEGCDCSKATGTDKGIYRVKCTAAQITAACKNSVAVEPKNFTKWRDSRATNEYLCVKRMPGISMNTTILLADTVNRKCQAGHKVCPPPSDEPLKDDFSRRACIPENQECPISQLRIAPCGNLPDNTQCFSKRAAEKLDGGMCLFSSNHCGTHPLTDISIGEEGICRHEKDQQIAANHTDYSLLRAQRKPCDNSENIFKFDGLTQKDLLDRNGINVADIGLYGDNVENYNFSLYTVAPHKWVWQHRDEMDLRLIFENQKYILRLENYHSKGITFFSLGLLVFLVASPILFYYENKKPYLYRENRFLLYAKYLVQWFFKLAAIPVIALILKYNSDIWVKFKTYGEAQFSNSIENAKIASMAKSLEVGVYGYDRVALWVAIATIIVDIYLLVGICKMEQKKIQQEDMDLDASMVGDGVELEAKY